MKLVLGSASPRRADLLAQIGIVAQAVRAADIDETPLPGELPRPHCARLAREKALAIDLAADEMVLCADTVVALGRRMLGKPRDRDQAADYLRRLSGRRHRVVTAVALRTADRIRERESITILRMKRLETAEIDAYLDSDEWRGKAGGYAVQGLAARFVKTISGSYSNVVGLPLFETGVMLDGLGFAPRAMKDASHA